MARSAELHGEKQPEPPSADNTTDNSTDEFAEQFADRIADIAAGLPRLPADRLRRISDNLNAFILADLSKSRGVGR